MMPAADTHSLEADAVLYGRLTPVIVYDPDLLDEARQRLDNLDDDARSFLQKLVEQRQPMTFMELDQLINGPRKKNVWEDPSDELIWQDYVSPILKKLILTGMVSSYDSMAYPLARWIPTPRGRAAAHLLAE